MMKTEQRKICQRFDAEFLPPDPGLKVGIALGTLTNIPLNAVRITPEGDTCGWYIYGGEYSTDNDFYQPLHVAHLNDYCPEIVPYLALPPGWCVLLAPNYEDVWFDEEMLKRDEET